MRGQPGFSVMCAGASPNRMCSLPLLLVVAERSPKTAHRGAPKPEDFETPRSRHNSQSSSCEEDDAG